MRYINGASFNSQQRGYDYYKDGMVKEFGMIDDGIIQALVKGSGGSVYDVEVNVNHPKKSKCNCPFADGNTKICKHKVATFFAAFPEEAKEYEEDVVKAIEEEEQYWEEAEYKLDGYLRSLTKAELISTVYELLYDLPEWAYERFIMSHIE